MATAVAEKSGSTTFTASGSGTEDTLLDTTDAGVYKLDVNTSNLANGVTPDIMILRVYRKLRATGDSFIEIWSRTFQGGLVKPNSGVESPAFECDIEMKFTLTQTQGTGRVFPWSVKGIG